MVAETHVRKIGNILRLIAKNALSDLLRAKEGDTLHAVVATRQTLLQEHGGFVGSPRSDSLEAALARPQQPRHFTQPKPSVAELAVKSCNCWMPVRATSC